MDFVILNYVQVTRTPELAAPSPYFNTTSMGVLRATTDLTCINPYLEWEKKTEVVMEDFLSFLGKLL
ncbi:hypothetical protein TNCV_3392301 [Trichonephila clavipes]|nr:hypothetical protein TNCV_3392301 [Trichonephila clavipes]